MPNAYGYDVTNATLAKQEMYTGMSWQKCKEVEELGGTWVGMTCGCWYEWHAFAFLGDNSFGIDIKKRTVTFFDEVTTKVQVSTWKQCGRALAALLSLPESGASPAVADWKNASFKFDSFDLSQSDMLDSLNRVMRIGDEDWDIKYVKAEDRVNEGLEAMKGGDLSGFAKAMYSRFFYKSGDSVYETSNEVLGLEREALDEQTKRIVDAMLGA